MQLFACFSIRKGFLATKQAQTLINQRTLI